MSPKRRNIHYARLLCSDCQVLLRHQLVQYPIEKAACLNYKNKSRWGIFINLDLRVKYPLFVSDFNQNRNLSTNSNRNPSRVSPSALCGEVGGETDRLDGIKSNFIANVFWHRLKRICVFSTYCIKVCPTPQSKIFNVTTHPTLQSVCTSFSQGI